jgi:SM-20-related protein
MVLIRRAAGLRAAGRYHPAMINPDIDFAPYRATLAQAGRVQIPDLFEAEAAERLHRCLRDDVPWTLALCDEAGMRTVPQEDYQALDGDARHRLFAATAASGRGGAYRFCYDSYMMPRAYVEGRDPGLLLHRLLEFLNAPPYLEFMRALTGEPRIRRLDAQATRYQSGQFLRTHNDAHSGEGRLYAYVLNLTAAWQADWGGLLQFLDDEGRVDATFMPTFNSLSLFRVPRRHAVSLVAPWAEQPRLAVTGWMLWT